jgi:hypothetical protein
MQSCKVLRCMNPAVEIHEIRSKVKEATSVPICGTHKQQIRGGARWLWADDGSLMLAGDADLAFPRLLRRCQARATVEAEIEKGLLERVLTLDLSYGFLGIDGDEDLTLHLSFPMASHLAGSLQRLLERCDRVT